MIKIKILFLFISIFSFGQKNITVLDSKSLGGIIDAQILSSEGALLFNTDSNGKFTLSQINGIKKIIIYHPSYIIREYDIDKVPDKIILEKRQSTLLDEIVLESKKKKQKYFKVKGYIRSYQLVNNKLVRYGDALIHYLIPYKKRNNDVVTGVKKHILSYRTFKVDSIRDESRIISISIQHDNFLNTYLPVRNIIKRQSYENYELKEVNDSLSSVIKSGRKVGYVVYKDKKPIKIGIDDYLSTKKSIFKFKSGTKDVEIWSNGKECHLLYSYSNEKMSVGNKTTETINEMFIDDNVFHDIKKPKKSKRHLKTDRSYYEYDYWSKMIKRHPLPTSIVNQLSKINENKNIF